MTARLLLVGVFGLRLALNRFPVCNTGNDGLDIHLCLCLDAVQDDTDMQVAHTGQYTLTGLAVIRELECHILFAGAGKQLSELVLVLFVSRRYGH